MQGKHVRGAHLATAADERRRWVWSSAFMRPGWVNAPNRLKAELQTGGQQAAPHARGAPDAAPVAQTSKSDVSRVSQPAGRTTGHASRFGNRRSSRLGNLRY